MTNRQFAKENEIFKQSCQEAKVEPTKRQASKFRRNLGKAFKAKGSVKPTLVQ
jgi:hypothetical protein